MSEVLGLRVDPVTVEGALDQIEAWVSEGRPRWVVTLNPEMVMHAQEQPGFRHALSQADMITADGIGIVWAAEKLGEPVPTRVSGIDLVEGLLRRSQLLGTRFYFLGSRPGVAQAAKERMLAMHPGAQIVGADHGYFTPDEEERIVSRIRESSPDVILVALGSPRQDTFISDHLKSFGRGVAIGVGGSLDVLAGVVKRAPRWIQRVKLEWLYRIALQPKRWGRALALPRFVWRVIGASRRVS